MADKRGYLPETPQEITADWLGSALGATVSNVQQQALGDGKGFMGDVLRLDIDTDDLYVRGLFFEIHSKSRNRSSCSNSCHNDIKLATCLFKNFRSRGFIMRHPVI